MVFHLRIAWWWGLNLQSAGSEDGEAKSPRQNDRVVEKCYGVCTGREEGDGTALVEKTNKMRVIKAV